MENRAAIIQREEETTERLLSYFLSAERLQVMGPKGMEGRTRVISVDFPSLDNAQVADELFLDAGIEIRVGLHCSPPAHRAMGTFPQGTVRFRPGFAPTDEEIQRAIESCKRVLDRLKPQ